MTYESKYYIPKCNQFYSIRLKFADYKDLRILKNFTYWLVKDFVGVTMTMNLAHLEDVIERCSFLKNGGWWGQDFFVHPCDPGELHRNTRKLILWHICRQVHVLHCCSLLTMTMGVAMRVKLQHFGRVIERYCSILVLLLLFCFGSRLFSFLHFGPINYK